MDVECMRGTLLEVYPGEGWKRRVTRMQESQVVAIYKSLERRQELFPHQNKKELYHQIDIWEWMKENGAAHTNS